MLFSVADYKARFGITGTAQDGQIAILRQTVSDLIANYCNREFENDGNDETEFHDADGTGYLVVRKPPIISVTSIHVDPARAFGSDTLVPTTDYEILTDVGHRDQGVIRFLESASAFPGIGGSFGDAVGSRAIKIVYAGGFTSIPMGLKEAAMRWSFSLSGREPGVTSLTIGSYSVSYSQGVGDTAIPPDIRLALSPYVRVGSRRRIL